jgi:quercetin dioxygenase-like cupin family protein
VTIAGGLDSKDDDRENIKRNGTQPSVKGPADWFTGNVRIDPLFDATEQARASGASVTFEPVPTLHGIPTQEARS